MLGMLGESNSSFDSFYFTISSIQHLVHSTSSLFAPYAVDGRLCRWDCFHLSGDQAKMQPPFGALAHESPSFASLTTSRLWLRRLFSPLYGVSIIRSIHKLMIESLACVDLGSISSAFACCQRSDRKGERLVFCSPRRGTRRRSIPPLKAYASYYQYTFCLFTSPQLGSSSC